MAHYKLQRYRPGVIYHKGHPIIKGKQNAIREARDMRNDFLRGRKISQKGYKKVNKKNGSVPYCFQAVHPYHGVQYQVKIIKI